MLPTRKPEQVSWISLTHKGADTRTKRNYDPVACGLLRQNKVGEEYVPDEGTRQTPEEDYVKGK